MALKDHEEHNSGNATYAWDVKAAQCGVQQPLNVHNHWPDAFRYLSDRDSALADRALKFTTNRIQSVLHLACGNRGQLENLPPLPKLFAGATAVDTSGRRNDDADRTIHGPVTMGAPLTRIPIE
jgi:hypothetical protein